MANAALKNGDPSTIEVTLNNNGQTSDVVWVGVRFADSASPAGKLVKVGMLGGTAAISGWTNANDPAQYRRLPGAMGGGPQEHTKYAAPAGPITVPISVFKAGDLTVPVKDYATHAADNAGVVMLDAELAANGGGKRVQIKRWTFTNGGAGDQAIITIVMLDDEGGGNDLSVRLIDIEDRGGFSRLLLAVKDRVFSIDAKVEVNG